MSVNENILKFLAEQRKPITTREVAASSSASVRDTFRALNQLEAEGAVTRGLAAGTVSNVRWALAPEAAFA